MDTETLRRALHDLPMPLVLFFLGVMGLEVGSFLNVVVYRLPRRCLSINRPKRSFCPSCRKQLRAWHNLPVVSWLLLRGRCGFCKARISLRYPLVELLTGVLFVLCVWVTVYRSGDAGDWHSWLSALHLLLMVGVLLPAGLIDLDLHIIPDELSLGSIPLFLLLALHPATMEFGLPAEVSALLFPAWPLWLNGLASALAAGSVAAAFLWGFGKLGNVLFAKKAKEAGGESMGFGDVKLIFLLGLMLGWPKLLAAFFLAVLSGAAIGLIARLRGHVGVPFGPFLAFGAMVAMLFARELSKLVEGYLNLLAGGAA